MVEYYLKIDWAKLYMYIINTRVVTKYAKQRGITNKLKVKIECLKYSNDLKEAGKEQQGKEQI